MVGALYSKHVFGCVKKEAVKVNLVRMCVWIDKDVRDEFTLVVRDKHGGERGGTGKEVETALRRHMLSARDTARSRNNYMEKLLNLVTEFEEMKGYPKLSKNMISFAIKLTIGKDQRTVQKYLKMVLARSKCLGGMWVVTWDVSPLVKEVYKCQRDGINPKYIRGGA